MCELRTEARKARVAGNSRFHDSAKRKEKRNHHKTKMDEERKKEQKKKKLSTRERWPASGEKLDDNSILSYVRRVQSIPAPGCTNWRTRVFFSFFFSFPHFLVLLFCSFLLDVSFFSSLLPLAALGLDTYRHYYQSVRSKKGKERRQLAIAVDRMKGGNTLEQSIS